MNLPACKSQGRLERKIRQKKGERKKVSSLEGVGKLVFFLHLGTPCYVNEKGTRERWMFDHAFKNGRGKKKDKTQKSGCILNWADFGIVNINIGKRILRVEMKT